MKSFSVVLTYFQQPEMLAHALYCLRQQTYLDFEVVPVFDEPDEQAAYVYNRFLLRNPDSRFQPIRVYPDRNPKHFGNDARHWAMQWCLKDYVIWYGHDCLLDKDYLQTHAEQIQDDACISIVGQVYFGTVEHPHRWHTLRGILPRNSDPGYLVMGGLDLLNFAMPLEAARSWAWAKQKRAVYEADWETFRDVRINSQLPVRIHPAPVCAHF